MRTMGVLATGLLTLSVAGGAFLFFRSIPEIRRYLKIKQMYCTKWRSRRAFLTSFWTSLTEARHAGCASGPESCSPSLRPACSSASSSLLRIRRLLEHVSTSSSFQVMRC